MIDEKKSVEVFRKKYKIKDIDKEKICKIIECQGYTIIPYSRYNNSEKLDFLIESLGIYEYVNSYCCFTYQDDKFRLVFINNELSDEEALIVLAHEEGHIWHRHVVSESVFGTDIKQEFEANEFAHYLLSDTEDKKRKRIKKIITCCVMSSVLFIGGGYFAKNFNDERVYMDHYYRTESGTKYHIKGCVYLNNKNDVRKLTKEEFESGEYGPCAVCIQFENND